MAGLVRFTSSSAWVALAIGLLGCSTDLNRDDIAGRHCPGRLPFDGANYKAIVHAVLSADMRSFPELGIDEPDLWAIVEKGLERDRDLRWQTSEDLADALGAWLIERGIMHDVTGVSLHATRTKSRVNQLRILETARPPSLPSEKLNTSREVQASTVSRASLNGIWLRQSRRSRYFFVMSMIVLCGAVLGWGLKRALRVAPTSPAQSLQRPELQLLPVVTDTTGAISTPPRIESTPLAGSAQAAPNSSPVGLASSAVVRAKKTKPKTPSPKSEQFKSPFE